MPTLRELVSILDLGHSTAFPDILTIRENSIYWSATKVAADDSLAWGVLASEALLYSAPRDGTAKALALCVGGEKWISSADISADEGWALDRSTGLFWQRGASLTTFSWSDALAYCEKLNLADYTDWRLPSAKELPSIVDDQQSGPAIDREAFPDAPSDVFWSSTPAISRGEQGILVDFLDGASVHGSVASLGHARCVRSDALQ